MSEGFQVLKFLLVGDSDSGKSCILLRYADDTFSTSYLPTIGVDFKIKTISVHGQEVKLQMWDTAGQERFRTITSSYFGGANGVMLVYNVASRSSFEAIRNVWLGEVNKHANASVVAMLIGSKADLHEAREVSYEEGRDLANQLEIDFEEVSAKENLNLEAAFTKLV